MSAPTFYRDLWGPGYDPRASYPMSGDDVPRDQARALACGLPAVEPSSRTRTAPGSSGSRCQGVPGSTPGSRARRRSAERALRQVDARGRLRGADRVHGCPGASRPGTTTRRRAVRGGDRPGNERRRSSGSATCGARRYDPKNRYPMSGDDVVGREAGDLAAPATCRGRTAVDTNVYGASTEDAVRAFQRRCGITGSGGGPPQGHYGELTHKSFAEGEGGDVSTSGRSTRARSSCTRATTRPARGRQADARRRSRTCRSVRVHGEARNSNSDSRSDGIRPAQRHTAGRRDVARPALVRLLVLLRAGGGGRARGSTRWLASVASIEDSANRELMLQGLDDRPWQGQARRPGLHRRLRESTSRRCAEAAGRRQTADLRRQHDPGQRRLAVERRRSLCADAVLERSAGLRDGEVPR